MLILALFLLVYLTPICTKWHLVQIRSIFVKDLVSDISLLGKNKENIISCLGYENMENHGEYIVYKYDSLIPLLPIGSNAVKISFENNKCKSIDIIMEY